MKAIKILLLSTLLYAGATLADRPLHPVRVGGLNLNFRPVEQLMPGMPKGSYQYKLDGCTSNDGHEFYNFYYSGSQLIATYSEVVGDYKLYDSLHYNDIGQLVRLSGWQWLNGQWTNVYYIDYTYNSQGLLATRSNYNHFSGNWELGGVYEYSYNTDGQLVLTELTMAGSSYVFQKVEYTYNDGLLKRELWSLNPSGMGMEPSESLTYTYSNGRKQTVYDSIWNGNGWDYEGRETFTYNADGNCTQHSTYDYINRETSRSEYEYNTTLLSATLMPYHPELTRPKTYGNVNTYTTEHWYQMDANQVFGYAWDYNYEYSAFVTISDTDKVPSMTVYPNPATERLYVDAPISTSYSLYDLAGRQHLSGQITPAGIDVSTLPAGFYRLHLGPYVISVVIQ